MKTKYNNKLFFFFEKSCDSTSTKTAWRRFCIYLKKKKTSERVVFLINRKIKKLDLKKNAFFL
jgi:hypothetical protein